MSIFSRMADLIRATNRLTDMHELKRIENHKLEKHLEEILLENRNLENEEKTNAVLEHVHDMIQKERGVETRAIWNPKGEDERKVFSVFNQILSQK